MKKFQVEVLKRMYCRGTIEVEAASQAAADEKVQNQIDAGKLQTTAVSWDDPAYEDGTFEVENLGEED